MTLENWSFSGNNLIGGPASTSLSDYFNNINNSYMGMGNGGTTRLIDPSRGYVLGNVQTIYPSSPISFNNPATTKPLNNISYQPQQQYTQPAIDMNSIIQKIMLTSPQTNTTQVQTQQQNQSPELENLINEFRNTINTLGVNTQSAFQEKSNTYSDLLASLANMYGAMAGGQSSAASTSALASGLTPLEATQAGNDVLSQVMQQYFPQRAGLAAEQAQVGVDLQNQLAALQQSLGLPLLQNIESPYWQNVAGNTTTTNSTTTDPYKQLSLLAQLAQFLHQQQSSDALGWAQLQQNANQFSQNLGQRQYEFNQGYLNDIQKLLQQQSMEQYKTDAGLGLEYNKMANDTALQQYLQQLRGTQSMDQTLAQIFGYGQNQAASQNLAYTLQQKGIEAQQARTQQYYQSAWDDFYNFIDSL